MLVTRLAFPGRVLSTPKIRRLKMKKIILLSLLTLISALALAHPAGAQNLRWDAKTNYLYVSYDHSVKNPADHFIQSVVIQVNGKTIITQLLTLQDTNQGGALVFKLPGMKKNDKIVMVSDCNKGGKKTSSIKVP